MGLKSGYFEATRVDKTSTFKGGVDVEGNFGFGDVVTDTFTATGNIAVTTADKLTVGGVIVPQETVVTAYLDASTTDGNIFIASDAWVVTHIEAAWTVASTSGTLMLDKCTGTEAPGSGDDMLTGTIDMSGTANTVTAGTLHGTAANITLADGDRIAIDIAGTMTNLAGGVVTVHMKRA